MGWGEKGSRTGGKKGSSLKGEANIEIVFIDEKVCRVVYGALLAELRNPPTYRSKIEMTAGGKSIKIKIFSRDLVSLRAAINSYLKWLATILGGIEVIRGEFGGYKKSTDAPTADACPR